MQQHNHRQTDNGTKLRCQRCGRQWVYHGRNPYFALCTFCKTTVSIRKNKIESLQSAQVETQDQTTTVATIATVKENELST
jgi:ribosomal protein L37E